MGPCSMRTALLCSLLEGRMSSPYLAPGLLCPETTLLILMIVKVRAHLYGTTERGCLGAASGSFATPCKMVWAFAKMACPVFPAIKGSNLKDQGERNPSDLNVDSRASVSPSAPRDEMYMPFRQETGAH